MVPDIWFSIFDMLPIQDLLALTQTSLGMKATVEMYWPHGFSFPKVLHGFIDYEEVQSFHDMLRETGGIIGGSTALQYLARTKFDESDLDVYVIANKKNNARDWLTEHGMMSIPVKRKIDVSKDYINIHEIEGVESFKTRDSSKVVQLISTR